MASKKKKAITKLTNALIETSSSEISDIKNSIGQERLKTGYFNYEFNDSEQSSWWRYGCPYWIKYTSGDIPSDDQLKTDLLNMQKLYIAIANQRMVTSLEEIMGNIASKVDVDNNNLILDGVSYTQMKLENMLRNFAIFPYEFRIDEWPLEYESADWERLSNN